MGDRARAVFMLVIYLLIILFLATVYGCANTPAPQPQPSSPFRESVGLNDKVSNGLFTCINRLKVEARTTDPADPAIVWRRCLHERGVWI